MKDKVIKKQKSLPPIEKDEEPFEIPNSWEWVRLGDIFSISSSKRVIKDEWTYQGIPFYRAREIVQMMNNSILKEPIFISEDTYEEKIKISGKPNIGDILITAVGTLGKTMIVNNDEPFYFKDGNIIWLKNLYTISPQYIQYLYTSDFMNQQIHSLSAGTTVNTYTIINANRTLLPLPPLPEQQRIVDKIKELFAELDKIDAAQEKYDSAANKLREKVLDTTMRGKLVPQDPNDEPASELLERIEKEKQRLIKEKIIKKQRTLPPISKDEVPFEIPNSWEWVRLGEIGIIKSGGTPKTKIEEYWNNGDIPWITPADMGKQTSKKYLVTFAKYITAIGLEKSSAQLIEKGSIIYSSRAPIGHINIVPFSYTTNQGCKSITPIIVITSFLYYILQSLKEDIIRQGSGTTFKEISLTVFSNIKLPLPPIQEQQRIVDAIEKILKTLD